MISINSIKNGRDPFIFGFPSKVFLIDGSNSKLHCIYHYDKLIPRMQGLVNLSFSSKIAPFYTGKFYSPFLECYKTSVMIYVFVAEINKTYVFSSITDDSIQNYTYGATPVREPDYLSLFQHDYRIPVELQSITDYVEVFFITRIYYTLFRIDNIDEPHIGDYTNYIVPFQYGYNTIFSSMSLEKIIGLDPNVKCSYQSNIILEAN